MAKLGDRPYLLRRREAYSDVLLAEAEDGIERHELLRMSARVRYRDIALGEVLLGQGIAFDDRVDQLRLHAERVDRTSWARPGGVEQTDHLLSSVHCVGDIEQHAVLPERCLMFWISVGKSTFSVELVDDDAATDLLGRLREHLSRIDPMSLTAGQRPLPSRLPREAGRRADEVE